MLCLMPTVAILKLCKKKKCKTSKRYKTSPYSRERGSTVLEALACCVSLSSGKGNKATLFYFLQTLSLYFYLASVDREPRFWQQSGLTEIIHLMCTSTVWGQYPAFLNPEFPLGAPLKVNAMVKSLTVGSYSGLMVATSFVY